MPNSYDVALRGRAVKAYESGEGSYAQVAALFDLDHRTLERWVACWRETGTLTPKARGGGGWRCPIDLAVLHAVIREVPDATVDELCWAYNRRVPRGQQTNSTSCRRAMHRAGFVLKTNGRGRAKSTAPTSPRSAKRS